MRKAEYIKWKETRGEDTAEWDRNKCRAADELVKRTALACLQLRLKGQPKVIRDYVILMARCHFGSVETDNFLQEMRAYPDWI